VLLGELALDCRVRPVCGVLPATLAAQQAGFHSRRLHGSPIHPTNARDNTGRLSTPLIASGIRRGDAPRNLPERRASLNRRTPLGVPMITDTDRLVCGVAPLFRRGPMAASSGAPRSSSVRRVWGVTLLRPVERKPCGRTHERVGQLTAIAMRRVTTDPSARIIGQPPTADACKRVAE
jgi:hypothetical protein